MPISTALVERLTREGVWDPEVEKATEAFWYHTIDQLRDERMRSVMTAIVEKDIPRQFFIAPASSSGKNHVPWQNGRTGLVRHVTEMAIGIWRIGQSFPELTDATQTLSVEAGDTLLAGVVLHDAWKGGIPWQEYTHTDHHAFAAHAWKQATRNAWLPPAIVENVFTAIWWHGGRWTPGWDGKLETLGTRTNIYAQILHTCDMVYSDTNFRALFQSREISMNPVRKR